MRLLASGNPLKPLEYHGSMVSMDLRGEGGLYRDESGFCTAGELSVCIVCMQRQRRYIKFVDEKPPVTG